MCSEKVIFFNKSADDNKNMKHYPACTELKNELLSYGLAHLFNILHLTPTDFLHISQRMTGPL